MKRILIIAAALALTAGTAFGQAAQLPAHYLWANPTSAQAPAQPASLSAYLDSAACASAGGALYRSGSAWTCIVPTGSNQFFVSNSSGTASFRALTNADIPAPTSSALGGVKSFAAVPNEWLTSIGTDGTPAASQPSAANLSNGTSGSGSVVLATSPTLSAPTLTSASLSSPTMTGSPTAPTPATGDNSTLVATTAWVRSAFTTVLNAACTAAPNTCSTFFGYANIVWFGAVPDNTTAHAAVNATAIQDAINTNLPALAPYSTSGGYNIGTNSFTINSGQKFSCTGIRRVTVFGQGSTVALINSVGPTAILTGCNFNMTGASAGSRAITFNTASGAVVHVRLRHIGCQYTYQCWGDNGTNTVSYLTVTDSYTEETLGGPQYSVSNSNGFVTLRDLSCNFTAPVSSAPTDWGCGSFSNFIGLLMGGHNIATGHGTGTASFFSVYAWSFSGTSMWNAGVISADNTTGSGVNLTGMQYLWSSGVLEGTLNLGYQVQLNLVHDFTISSLICDGANTVTGAVGASSACVISNSYNGSIAQTWADNATGNNVDVNGSQSGITFGELTSKGATGYGFALADSADYIKVLGGYLSGNGGTVDNTSTGTHNVITNLGGYNPVGASTITVGASPFTYTAGLSPESVYITGGTVSGVTVGGVTACAASPCSLSLGPNESAVVTYTGTPTMVKSVH